MKMKFEVCYNDRLHTVEGIYLMDDGTVYAKSGCFEGAASARPDSDPATGMCGVHDPLGFFISKLDLVAKQNPEVYKRVYEHIKGNNDFSYICVADYCKKKSKEMIEKLTIIE